MVIIQKLKSQGKHKLNQNKYFKCFKTVNKWFKILHKVLVCSSVFCLSKLQFFFSIEGNPLHFTRLSWWNRFITSNIFLSMIYFLNEAFQEATLNFSIVHYWSPRITTSSQVCWIFKQLVAILVRLGALSFKHIFFPKIISKNEKSSLKVKLLHVLLCCELEGLLHIVLLRKVVTILKWNSQNCFWLSEMF